MDKATPEMIAKELRRKAELSLAQRPASPNISEVDTQRLLHELQVHQIELEMQNEELRTTLAALHESEVRYRLLAELASECIFWVGPAGQMLYVSPACQLVFGHAPEAFLADSGLLESLIHPEDRAAFKEHTMQEEFADNTVINLRILHPDGSERSIEHYCEPMRDETGAYLGRRSSNRDISSRMKDQSNLKDRNAELNAFNKLMVGREVAMTEIKKQVNALCRELDKEPPYPVGFPPKGINIYQYYSGGWV